MAGSARSRTRSAGRSAIPTSIRASSSSMSATICARPSCKGRSARSNCRSSTSSFDTAARTRAWYRRGLAPIRRYVRVPGRDAERSCIPGSDFPITVREKAPFPVADLMAALEAGAYRDAPDHLRQHRAPAGDEALSAPRRSAIWSRRAASWTAASPSAFTSRCRRWRARVCDGHFRTFLKGRGVI